MSNHITGGLVVYNTCPTQLTDLLESLPTESFELVVVDNSPINKLSVLFENRVNVKYCFVGKNIGFGKGHNLAFQMVSAYSKFHFVLNPDVYFEKGVIAGLVDILRYDLSIGVIGPKILYPNGEIQYSCRLLPSPLDLIFRRLPFHTYRERREVKNELRFSSYKERMDVPFLLGCFLCFRSDVYMSIGGFDERYFMYLEDTDICRKVLKSHRVLFDPEYVVFHTYSKASTVKLRLFFIHLFSAITYFNKWGWFFDKEKTLINRKVLSMLNTFL